MAVLVYCWVSLIIFFAFIFPCLMSHKYHILSLWWGFFLCFSRELISLILQRSNSYFAPPKQSPRYGHVLYSQNSRPALAPWHRHHFHIHFCLAAAPPTRKDSQARPMAGRRAWQWFDATEHHVLTSWDNKRAHHQIANWRPILSFSSVEILSTRTLQSRLRKMRFLPIASFSKWRWCCTESL